MSSQQTMCLCFKMRNLQRTKNIKIFNTVLVYNMLINEQKLEIQCKKVQNMSNLDNVYIWGTSSAQAHNRLDIPFKV